MRYTHEETRLVKQIGQARKQIAEEYSKSILRVGEIRRSRGEVCVEGVWVPKELVARVRRRLARGDILGFVEFNLAVLVGVLLLNVIWIGFERFLLP